MLVRNITSATLKLRRKGKKQDLPARVVTTVNEFDFPEDFIRNTYGKYVVILTDKAPVKVEVVNENISTETKDNLDAEKGIDNAPAVDETSTTDKEDELTNVEGGSEDKSVEDVNNDDNTPDGEGAQESQEIKEELEGEGAEEEVSEETEADKEEVETKTKSKKSGKKKANKKAQVIHAHS